MAVRYEYNASVRCCLTPSTSYWYVQHPPNMYLHTTSQLSENASQTSDHRKRRHLTNRNCPSSCTQLLFWSTDSSSQLQCSMYVHTSTAPPAGGPTVGNFNVSAALLFPRPTRHALDHLTARPRFALVELKVTSAHVRSLYIHIFFY